MDLEHIIRKAPLKTPWSNVSEYEGVYTIIAVQHYRVKGGKKEEALAVQTAQTNHDLLVKELGSKGHLTMYMRATSGRLQRGTWVAAYTVSKWMLSKDNKDPIPEESPRTHKRFIGGRLDVKSNVYEEPDHYAND